MDLSVFLNLNLPKKVIDKFKSKVEGIRKRDIDKVKLY